MSVWWFFVEKLQMLFSGSIVDDEPLKETEETIELYHCTMCDTMFADKDSYVMHFKLDTCTVLHNIFPEEPFEFGENND